VLPGDGVADLPGLLGALEAAGWRGYYDVEIFSDNGAFGDAWPDSLWDVPPEKLARRAKESFERVWEARNRSEVDQVSPGAV
jgi:sugar phosphate isomerase/epimerase